MNRLFGKWFSLLSGKLLPRVGYPVLAGPLRGPSSSWALSLAQGVVAGCI
jgi:hypothetical protein